MEDHSARGSWHSSKDMYILPLFTVTFEMNLFRDDRMHIVSNGIATAFDWHSSI